MSDDPEQISYDEIDAEVKRRAVALHRLGLGKPGVADCTPESVLAVVSIADPTRDLEWERAQQ